MYLLITESCCEYSSGLAVCSDEEKVNTTLQDLLFKYCKAAATQTSPSKDGLLIQFKQDVLLVSGKLIISATELPISWLITEKTRSLMSVLHISGNVNQDKQHENTVCQWGRKALKHWFSTKWWTCIIRLEAVQLAFSQVGRNHATLSRRSLVIIRVNGDLFWRGGRPLHQLAVTW